MLVQLKSEKDIEKLRHANLIVSDVLDICQDMAKPGVTTWDMEVAARKYLDKVGAKSAFLNYAPSYDLDPYPAVLCTSRNERVVHGIPSEDEVLEEGDILSVDFGAFYKGFCGDSARTYEIGKVSDAAHTLSEVTKKSLEKAIEQMIPGNRLGDVSNAVQTWVESQGFSVIRDFVGHGIGRSMHEPPQVPNYGPKGRGMILKPGLVLAIEPMVTEGSWQVEVLDDGWTVVTRDRKLAAHFEHSVAVTEKGPIVLSRR
ncbi:MAG: type I methionyl aminopeptidase [Deltaproteobacteria bacterium]|nr:type I methionyl aminopeptidase [Deltaproteobacteria bacterium]